MKELTLPLSEIKPYQNNAREIHQAIPVVAESIKRFGYIVPIVVDKKHVIITGHTRYEALKLLGYTEARVIVSEMSKALANEYRIVDNRSAEIAEWDRDRLIAELRAIEGGMEPFFKAEEYKDLMSELLSLDEAQHSQAEIENRKLELDGHFQKLHANMEKRTQFVHCKHCGKRFGFDTDIVGFGKEWQPNEQPKS